MKLFRREEDPFAPLSRRDARINARPSSHTQSEQPPEDSESSDSAEFDWDAEVTKRMGMTAAELFRDASEDVVNGDIAAGLVDEDEAIERDDDDEDGEINITDATIFYARAGVVATLAAIRAQQELNETGKIDIPRK